MWLCSMLQKRFEHIRTWTGAKCQCPFKIYIYISSIRKDVAANMMGRYVPGARPNVRPNVRLNVRPNDRTYDRTYDRTTETYDWTYDRTTERPREYNMYTYNIIILSLSKHIFQYMIMCFNIRWGAVVSGRLVTWLSFFKKGGTCCEQQKVEICFFGKS